MRILRLALAVAVLTPALGPGAARAAETGPQPLPTALTLTALEPRAPTPRDDLVVAGIARNTGKTTLRGLRVRLRVADQPVRSRSALAAQAASTAAFGASVNAPAAAALLADLPPGGRASFTLRAPFATLGLPRAGVYPFGVDLRGDGGDGVATLGRLRTWLPVISAVPAGARPGMGRTATQRTTISWLWPLVDVPDRRPDGSFPTDALAASVAPSGRLGRLLAATSAARATIPGTRTVPLTVAIDPALLEALADMAGGYLVRPADGTAVAGGGQAVAAGFLRRLKQLTAGAQVLALPYADPDLAALVRAGRGADVGVATGSPTFRQLVQRVLGTAPLERIAWPPGGLAPQSTLEALSSVDTVVLSGTALPALSSLSYTPGAASTLPAVGGGTLRALVSDPTLDALVAADPAGAGGPRLAEQRFLAETAMITFEQPSVSRSVVVAPPRRWTQSGGWAATLLADSGRVPWLRPVRLTDLRPTPGPPTRGPLTYPRSAEQAELPASVFTGPGGIQQLGTGLRRFRAIVSNPESAGVPAMERALLRCESSAWQQNPAAGRALRAATGQALRALTGKVRITTRGTVSLASKKSTIPISVANGLNQPVRVQVAVNSRAARLIAEDTGTKVISGGHQIQLSVGLQAPGSGVFPLTASLLTPDGEPYGVPVPLRVYSSRYGTLALAITVAAFAVLAAIAAVRLGRRLRATRRPRTAQ